MGCSALPQLNDNALALAARSAKTLNVEYSTDPVAIAEAGIMATPALLVNGKVVSQGKVLTESEIEGAAVNADGGSERSADEQEESKAERHFVCRISQGFGCSKQNWPPWPVSDRRAAVAILLVVAALWAVKGLAEAQR